MPFPQHPMTSIAVPFVAETGYNVSEYCIAWWAKCMISRRLDRLVSFCCRTLKCAMPRIRCIGWLLHCVDLFLG
jgi:hypothetical protein